MRVTIHVHRAGTTDTLATVIVIDDRILTLADELIIEHIDHLEEGSILIDMLHLISLKVTLLMTVALTPNLNFNVYKLIHNPKCVVSIMPSCNYVSEALHTHSSDPPCTSPGACPHRYKPSRRHS